MTRHKAKPKVKYTSEQIDKSLDNERLRLQIFFVLAIGISAGLFVLMLTPLAKSIAGTNTNFDVSVSLAFNFALAISTVTGGAGCFELNRRRRHHQRRARELEKRVVEQRGASSSKARKNT